MKGIKDPRAYAEQFFNPPVVSGQTAGSYMERIHAEAQATREKKERLRAQRLAAEASGQREAAKATSKARARRAILGG